MCASHPVTWGPAAKERCCQVRAAAQQIAAVTQLQKFIGRFELSSFVTCCSSNANIVQKGHRSVTCTPIKKQNISVTAGCCYSRLLPVKPSGSQKISRGFYHHSIKHKHHEHKGSSPLWNFSWQKQHPLSPKTFALI